jgi:hypothetical protein
MTYCDDQREPFSGSDSLAAAIQSRITTRRAVTLIIRVTEKASDFGY